MSHYVTAKFGVRGFTESLRMEMQVAATRSACRSCTRAASRRTSQRRRPSWPRPRGRAHPDADRRLKLYNEKLLKMPPSKAAEIILDGVEKGKMRILVGNDAKIMDLFERATPTLIHKPLVAFTKRLV